MQGRFGWIIGRWGVTRKVNRDGFKTGAIQQSLFWIGLCDGLAVGCKATDAQLKVKLGLGMVSWEDDLDTTNVLVILVKLSDKGNRDEGFGGNIKPKTELEGLRKALADETALCEGDGIEVRTHKEKDLEWHVYV